MNKYIITYGENDIEVLSDNDLDSIKEDIKKYQYILFGKYSLDTSKIKDIKEIK